MSPEAIRSRLERAGLTVRIVERGLVSARRGGLELGVLSWEGWRVYADGRGWW